MESQELMGMSEERPSDVPIPILPIRTQVVGEVLDPGTPKLNAIAKKLGHVTIDFLQMSLYEVYAIQNVADAEIKLREGALIKEEKVANKTVNKMKKTIKELEKKYKTWEENMNILENVVTLSCTTFLDACIT